VNIDNGRLSKIAWFSGLALASSAFFLPIINPDIFWHFSAARFMAAHLRVPRTDFLTWTMQGREWVDFEWLSQLILYSMYRLGGFKLLLLFKGALLAAVTVISWRTAALGGRFRAAWLYMPFFAAGMIVAGDLRPENFSLLFSRRSFTGLNATGWPRHRFPSAQAPWPRFFSPSGPIYTPAIFMGWCW